MSSTTSFYRIYRDLHERGAEIRPRGQLTRELLNYQYTLLPFDRFANFPSRPLNIDYIKAELRWYLRADLEDLSICQRAKIWEDCVTRGRLYSNYGHYIFKQSGLDYVVRTLRADPDSRRAVITILGTEHLFEDNRDVPCTSLLVFHVRDGQLRLSVSMRSQDAVFGLGNDVPFFSVVQELAAKLLNLPLGPLTVSVASFHVYERHLEVIRKIVENGEEQLPVACPRLSSPFEVRMLIAGDDSDHALSFPFTRWLRAAE